jgi:prevent-host-death family protein
LSGDEYQTEHSLVQQTPGDVTVANVINIHEAKTHLSRIVEEVAAGGEVIIAKAGRRVAKLVPLEPVGKPKKLGGLKGRVRVPDDLRIARPLALPQALPPWQPASSIGTSNASQPVMKTKSGRIGRTA